MRVAWWLPITRDEWFALSSLERNAIVDEVTDLLSERKGSGGESLTGQTRQDRKLGLGS